MALRQPSLQAIQRAVKPATENRTPTGEPSQARQQPVEQSQTWVLFSPATEGTTTTSEFSETIPSIQSTGRLQLSDVESAQSVPRPVHNPIGAEANTRSEAEAEAVEDDAELDGLDGHLPSFRSFPRAEEQHHDNTHLSNPVFPAHDGLGSFHVDQAMSSLDAQAQMYQFERYNPHRLHVRRESLDLSHLENYSEHVKEVEKRQRIEAWRLEHSQVLLDEIQKHTRRRRRSQASSVHPSRPVQSIAKDQAIDSDVNSDNLTWHDEDADMTGDEPEGFLARVTQKVIKDILGIDDQLLSILLGETFPEDEELPGATHHDIHNHPVTAEEQSWHDRIADSVSRELGLLVNHLTHHPGGFSTYSRIHQQPLPYAGLPVIPETNSSQANDESTASLGSEKTLGHGFKPTIRKATSNQRNQQDTTVPSIGATNSFTKEEWEQELDIKLVFRYICSRFNLRAAPTPYVSSAHLATTSTQDTAAKAARVRQHHPLIARARPVERRTFKPAAPSSPARLRHHSSCASQSTRRSARRSSGSSRHYWDIGGSLGTGSMIASNGPMGSWGEI